MSALDAVAAISPRPLLIVHGTDDLWVPVAQARELRDRAGPPCRYVEVDGANHCLRLAPRPAARSVAGWLDEAGDARTRPGPTVGTRR